MWRRRPESGTDAAAREGSTIRRAAAVPDPVVSATGPAVPDNPATSVSTAHADPVQHGGKKKKRKSAEAVTAAKKKSKATSERDSTGVQKLRSGKYESRIRWGGKRRQLGTFDTPEQASAAYISVRKDRDDVELSALGADEVDAAFDAAKMKAVKAVGKPKATSERDLPQGVQELPSGKFKSMISWGNKVRYIGTFDTPEQASATYISVKKDRDDVELSALGADEVDAAFDAAKQKAVKAEGGFVRRKKKLPRGVWKTSSGTFGSQIGLGGRKHYIGVFNTPEQASAAYVSVKKDLDDGNLSGLGADEVNAISDAAKKKAVEEVGGFIPEKRDLPTGVLELPSGKFQSRIQWGGKNRLIGKLDTPEQASAAYMSMKNDLDDAKLSGFGADEVDDILDAAKKKALETVQALMNSDEYGDEHLV